MTVVIDASLALAWVIPDETHEQLLDELVRLADTPIIAPSHWPAEVANALVMAERRGRVDLEKTSHAVALFDGLSIELDFVGVSNAFTRVLPLARAHGLTVYDALYLELAERGGYVLASLDRELRDAAVSIGLKVIP